MLVLASEAFGFELHNDANWGRVASLVNHVPWEGAVFWELIQPAFMFMVAWRCPSRWLNARRRVRPRSDNFRHVLGRSLRL